MIEEIESLPQSDIDALLAAMKREADKQRRYERFGEIYRLSYLVLMVAQFIHFFMWNHHFTGFGFILAILAWIPSFIVKRMNTQQRKKTVEELAKARDVRIVGPLCDALGFQDGVMVGIACETLVEILPRLRSSDANLLNREQRDRLYGMLPINYKPLVLATLKALEQIGDEKAIPFVEKLANSEPIVDNDSERRKAFRKFMTSADRVIPLANQDAEVREAAQHCLPFLRERAAAQKAGQELLHASSPDANIADLLRPASSQATEPQELLRASVSGE